MDVKEERIFWPDKNSRIPNLVDGMFGCLVAIVMYKLTHGLIDIGSRKYFIHHPESRTRGSHQFKFRVPYASKGIFKFSFFPRTIATGMELPP